MVGVFFGEIGLDKAKKRFYCIEHRTTILYEVPHERKDLSFKRSTTTCSD